MSANKSTIAKGITQPHSKESYALVLAIQHWRPYLWGKKHYVTCHAALRYLYSMQNTSNMLTLWAIALQSYDVTVKHEPGNVLDAKYFEHVDPMGYSVTVIRRHSQA